MIGVIIKQPNDKYCITNPYDGRLVIYNLTEQEVINLYIDDAKYKAGRDIKSAKHYGTLIGKTNNISDNTLKEMGFNKTYKELIKLVPSKPVNQSYASCDFATYGKCPSCGERVMNGMGHTDEKCRNCGQLLKW